MLLFKYEIKEKLYMGHIWDCIKDTHPSKFFILCCILYNLEQKKGEKNGYSKPVSPIFMQKVGNKGEKKRFGEISPQKKSMKAEKRR